MIDALREHQTRQQSEKQQAGQDWQMDDLIFPAGAGRPYEPGNLRRWLGD